MVKTRKHKMNKPGKINKLQKTLSANTNKTLTNVNHGLEHIGNTAKKSAPIVEKGVAGVYDTLATGFDMGVKGISKVKKTLTIKHKRVKTRNNKKRKSYHNRKQLKRIN